jgi:hypothetical protein
MFFSWFRQWLTRAGRFSSKHRERDVRRSRWRPTVEALEDRRLLSIFTVSNTGDNAGVNPAPFAGTGTLRQAIVDANATPGLDTIQFKIGTGAQSIAILAALPQITDSVILDGTSQPGFSGKPLIELNGTQAGAGVDGLVLAGGTSSVQGLVIDDFTGNGIAITSANNFIVGNYIGTDPTGTAKQSNGGDGVAVFATGNTIGGNTAASVNVISGNTGNGISLVDGSNTVLGNRIGTDVTGAVSLGNGSDGVIVFSASNTIGGITSGAANLISGNGRNGVEITGSAGSGNTIEGNQIGTDVNGTAALGNGADGVIVFATGTTVGGSVTGAGNLISGNTANGVDLVADGNMVVGNRIGTDTQGTTALGNGADGVIVFSANNTIGGGAMGAGNVISANAKNGIEIADNTASGNTITGNSIGTDLTGSTILGNGGNGVLVYSANNVIGGTDASALNLISGNAGNGIDLDGNGNQVLGNRIGTNLSGSEPLSNGADGVVIFSDGNTVGGSTPGAGNLISGNVGQGVDVIGNNNVVQGNFIGPDASGSGALGNGKDGALVFGANNTIGGSTSGAGNLISGNGGDGVEVAGTGATGNVIQSNHIGTDLGGTGNIGNNGDGVRIEASGNTIGDNSGAAANTIAFNHGNGVNTVSGSGNAILQNSIFSNGLLNIAPAPVIPTPSPGGSVPTVTVTPYVVNIPHPGRDNLVQVLNAATGQEVFHFLAFPGPRTRFRVFVLDVNGDGVSDMVVMSMGRKSGRVRIIDGSTGQQLAGPLGSFMAMPGVHGAVAVAMTDYNGDGVPDLVISGTVANKPLLKVYNGLTGTVLASLSLSSGRARHHLPAALVL